MVSKVESTPIEMRIAGDVYMHEKLLGEGTFGVVALYSNQQT